MDYNNIDPDNVTKNNNNKKLILPMAVAITTLIILSLGATYAYIQVQTTNNFGEPTISGTVPSIGNVTMNAGTSLSLSVSRPQMMKDNPATYYATSGGMSTTSADMQTIATATVSGEGVFTCTYILNVKGEGTLLTNSWRLGNNLVTLEISSSSNGNINQTYDFNDDLNSTVLSPNGTNISGQFTGLSISQLGTIYARFKLTNSQDKDQSELNNTSGTITFTVSNLNCTATG